MSDMDALKIAYLSETALKIAFFLAMAPVVLLGVYLIFDIVNQNDRKDI